MRTRSALSVVAVASASLIVGAIVVEGTAASSPARPVAGAAAGSGAKGVSQGSLKKAGSSGTTPVPDKAHAPASSATGYAPPRPGRYTYTGPNGGSMTQLAVTAAGPGAWRLDESVFVRSALVQRRVESWTASGVRVLAVGEAGQAQACVWSSAPLSVAFPITAT
ncbi:MAG: hypothetical protein QOD07_984, partial [Frankiaceae bacterium]|nr:hypothetical protein [Frankiaceae bacterium]